MLKDERCLRIHNCAGRHGQPFDDYHVACHRYQQYALKHFDLHQSRIKERPRQQEGYEYCRIAHHKCPVEGLEEKVYVKHDEYLLHYQEKRICNKLKMAKLISPCVTDYGIWVESLYVTSCSCKKYANDLDDQCKTESDEVLTTKAFFTVVK